MFDSIKIVRDSVDFHSANVDVYLAGKHIGYVHAQFGWTGWHAPKKFTAYDAGRPFEGDQGEYGTFSSLKAAVAAVVSGYREVEAYQVAREAADLRHMIEAEMRFESMIAA